MATETEPPSQGDLQEQNDNLAAENARLGRQLRHLRIGVGIAIAVTLMASVAGARFLFGEKFDESGEVEQFGSGSSKPALVDNVLKVASWNSYRKTEGVIPRIRYLMYEEDFDVMAVQEVERGDLPKFDRELPGVKGVYVVADSQQRDRSIGNLILSWQEPSDIKKRKLSGSSMSETLTRTIENEGRLGKGRQEDRAIVSARYQVRNGNNLVNYRFSTSHLAGGWNKVHDRQLRQVVDYQEDLQQYNEPLVFGGDVNDERYSVTTAFGDAGMINPPHGSVPTSHSGKSIDRIIFRAAGVLNKPRIRVIRVPSDESDHNIVTAEWRLPGPENGQPLPEPNELVKPEDRTASTTHAGSIILKQFK